MKSLVGLLAISLFVTHSFAGNWPHWRGPHFDGSTDEKNLPAEFSKTQGVAWKASLPGSSAATPIIWEDRVFLSCADEQSKGMRALCLDRKSGKILWNQEVGAGYNYDEKSNFASPSPVTDGNVAVFLYGNGEVAAFDLAGKKLWGKSLQKEYGAFAYQWTYGASPTIYDKQVLIQVLNRNQPVHGRGKTDGPIDSYILSLEPQTGKELWRHVRPSDAKQESQEAYSSVIPFEHNGRTELLVAGGDCITGHNSKDGTELWRWGTWNPERITHWRLVPSPVAGNGIILACAPKGSPVYAFKAGAKGTQTDSVLAWKSSEREVSSDVATPLFYKGKFYILRGEQRPTISRVDPTTGKVEWMGEIENRTKIESSPTGADDKIYFQNFHGDVFVVGTGDSFKLISTVPMGDEGDSQNRSSIAAAAGQLFIRTGHTLYCVGGGAKVAEK
jgi:outer membrane protein assembly factor BamB